MQTRAWAIAGLAVGLGLLAGCGEPVAKFEGPTVKEFTGKLVHNGKPVSFQGDKSVTLKVFHEKGQSFGIPIKPDGSFQIGWMPTGKYSASLIREKSVAGGKASAPNMYGLPGDALIISDGQTEYTIELGKGYKA
jgi:hypothetical protein